ncbi:4Fe-4S ferredoxin [Azospirillum sp. TSH7]|uniref:4Fe-4S dicluster domain-containing protein n=1 Tax=unclassified Azospirillum TaxID=2630922 RepID=UPI000D6151B7|nr:MULTISPECIES: ferredoxin family protein [unclassified Azospirillum]PWC60768.1 4Fe-4S ferredoxin [Azospirillum sp. TSH20]PWC67302.1 4Fe-4S ferredoxin [Azospirillum sp. TSH7]
MIELISPTRCTGCNICVSVCPMDVFQPTGGGRAEGAAPVIARQSDCQTCFLCEAHCPDDALYVAPDAETVTGIAEDAVAAAGLFGSYRRAIGWTAAHRENRSADQTFRLLAPH